MEKITLPKSVEQVYGNEGEEAVFAWNGYSQIRPAK